MNGAIVLVILSVGLPAMAFDDLTDILGGGGDFGDLGVNLNLGTNDDGLDGLGNLDSVLGNGVGGIPDADDLDKLSIPGVHGHGHDNGDRYDSDDFRFYPIPVEIDNPSGFGSGSRHVSSVADLVNLVFGLGGHVAGRAGWIVRDALGSLYRVGKLVPPTVEAGLQMTSLLTDTMHTGVRLAINLPMMAKSPVLGGLKVASILAPPMVKGLTMAAKVPIKGRDGLLFSQYRLSDNNFGLQQRSHGHLRSHQSQPSNVFDTLRRRFDSDRR